MGNLGNAYEFYIIFELFKNCILEDNRRDICHCNAWGIGKWEIGNNNNLWEIWEMLMNSILSLNYLKIASLKIIDEIFAIAMLGELGNGKLGTIIIYGKFGKCL